MKLIWADVTHAAVDTYAAVDADDRYSVNDDGLLVLGVSATDKGDYTCRAEVEADGRYDERRIHVEVHGKSVILLYCL